MLNLILVCLSRKWCLCLDKQVPKWNCEVHNGQKARVQDISPYGYFHSLSLCPHSLQHVKVPFLLRFTSALAKGH